MQRKNLSERHKGQLVYYDYSIGSGKDARCVVLILEDVDSSLNHAKSLVVYDSANPKRQGECLVIHNLHTAKPANSSHFRKPHRNLRSNLSV